MEITDSKQGGGAGLETLTAVTQLDPPVVGGKNLYNL